MEHYNNEISSEVKTQPKNKKKVILIAVVSVAVVLLILISSLIPALILNAKIESLIDVTTELKYIEFRRNEDNKSFRAFISDKYILPEALEIPSFYDNYPVTEFMAGGTSTISITLAEGITRCEFYRTNDLVTVYLPKTIESLGRDSSEVSDYSYFHTCPDLKTIYLHKETIVYKNGIIDCENAKLIYYE